MQYIDIHHKVDEIVDKVIEDADGALTGYARATGFLCFHLADVISKLPEDAQDAVFARLVDGLTTIK